MGWFSNKKKTHVATQISRMADDELIPDARQKNLIDSIFKQKRLTSVTVNNTLNSHTVKVENAYRSAARGDYYYGTPNHNVMDAAKGRDVAKSIIELEIGAPIRIEYFQFAPVNNIHVAWDTLTEAYNYDEFTNRITGAPGQGSDTWWVHNVVGYINTAETLPDSTSEKEEGLVPDLSTLKNWDRHPQDRYTPHRGNAPKKAIWLMDPEVEDGAMVTFIDKSGNLHEMFVPLKTDVEDDPEAFHVKYKYDNNKIGYFTYYAGTGTYPGLDSVHNGEIVGNGSFLPIVFFRHHRVDRTAKKYHDTEAYKSSRRLMNRMGMDYQQMGDSINSAPDADKLQQAVMMFAVPASTQDSVEIEYVYKFFDWLHKQNSATENSLVSGSFVQTSTGKAITIADADFRCTLSYDKLSKRQVKGKLAAPEGYEHERVTETRYITTRKRIRSSGGPGDPAEYEDVVQAVDYEVLAYRYQKRADSYEEVRVEGLSLRYHIYGSKGVTADISSDKLLIPLDYNICRTFLYNRKDRLYHRAMYNVFNSKVTETVKWYERGTFKILISAVIIVITIASGGATSPLLVAWEAGALAVALLLIEVIVTNIIVSLVVTEVAKVIITELGIDAGFVLAIVAFAAAAYGVSMDKSWGELAMAASNGLSSASSMAVKDKLAEYKSESEEFELLAEEKMEELEEVDNLLGQYDLLDPRSFIGQVPSIKIGEPPDDLYNRTIHTGNPGTLQYDYIESYVAINTQLPTLDHLVGDTFYGKS